MKLKKATGPATRRLLARVRVDENILLALDLPQDTGRSDLLRLFTVRQPRLHLLHHPLPVHGHHPKQERSLSHRPRFLLESQ